jgi:hypothetical protein
MPEKKGDGKIVDLMIEKLDLFQRPVPNFTVRGRSTISSPLGFVVSIFIILSALLFAAVLLIEFLGGENQFRTIQNI